MTVMDVFRHLSGTKKVSDDDSAHVISIDKFAKEKFKIPDIDDHPVTAVVTTDANGNWKFEMRRNGKRCVH